MTRQEFTSRTKVEVSNNEFETIHEFYMTCECDKDQFCKMWVKMNPARVKNAIIEKKQDAREESYRNTLQKFYNKTNGIDLNTSIGWVNMTAYEVKAMSHAGIKLANDFGSGLKTVLDIRYEIGKYLRMF